MTFYERFLVFVESFFECGLDLEQAESEALGLFSEEEKKEIIRCWEEDMRELEKRCEVDYPFPVVPEDIPW